MVTLPELHNIVTRFTFPSTKDELIEQAKKRQVSQEVLDRLQQLPEHYYGSVDTVIDTLRGLD